MSKSAALSMLSGLPPQETTAGLMTPDLPQTLPESLGKTDDQTHEAKPDELQSNRMAIFAKKESKLQQEREALKKERESYLKDKEESDAIRNRQKQFEETKQRDPIAALKLLGYSETEIFNGLAEQEQGAKELSPVEAARQAASEEVQKIREELATEKATLEKERNDRLISNLKADIGSTIQKEADKFEYCNFEGESAHEQIYEIIVDELRETGKLLSPSEAAEIAEELYEARDKAMMGIKKRQPAGNKPEPESAVTTPEAPSSVKQGIPPKANVASPAKPRTLTNQVTSTIASTAAKTRESSAAKRQRLEEALRRGSL